MWYEKIFIFFFFLSFFCTMHTRLRTNLHYWPNLRNKKAAAVVITKCETSEILDSDLLKVNNKFHVYANLHQIISLFFSFFSLKNVQAWMWKARFFFIIKIIHKIDFFSQILSKIFTSNTLLTIWFCIYTIVIDECQVFNS